MPVNANIVAVELSTFVITAAFIDEDGAAVVPSSISWTLQDVSGNIINNRTSVSVTPASTITIVLAGNDLALLDQKNDSELRRIIITAAYTSSLGSGLPLSDSYEFRVLNTNAIVA